MRVPDELLCVGFRLGRRIDSSLHPGIVTGIDTQTRLVSLLYDDGCCEDDVELEELELLPPPQDDISMFAMSDGPTTGLVASKCDLSQLVDKSIKRQSSRRRTRSLWDLDQNMYTEQHQLELNFLPLASRCLTCRKHSIWRCRRCNQAFYCSKRCQLLGAATHKQECVEQPFQPLFQPLQGQGTKADQGQDHHHHPREVK